jgi:hypothetical protein
MGNKEITSRKNDTYVCSKRTRKEEGKGGGGNLHNLDSLSRPRAEEG